MGPRSTTKLERWSHVSTSIDLGRQRRAVSQYVDHSETVDSKIPNYRICLATRPLGPPSLPLLAVWSHSGAATVLTPPDPRLERLPRRLSSDVLPNLFPKAQNHYLGITSIACVRYSVVYFGSLVVRLPRGALYGTRREGPGSSK